MLRPGNNANRVVDEQQFEDAVTMAYKSHLAFQRMEASLRDVADECRENHNQSGKFLKQVEEKKSSNYLLKKLKNNPQLLDPKTGVGRIFQYFSQKNQASPLTKRKRNKKELSLDERTKNELSSDGLIEIDPTEKSYLMRQESQESKEKEEYRCKHEQKYWSTKRKRNKSSTKKRELSLDERTKNDGLIEIYPTEKSYLMSQKKIKIGSWNINGLRNILKQKNLQEFIKTSNPDILCLQEIRICDKDFNEDLAVKEFVDDIREKGYLIYVNPSDLFKGQGGTLILTRFAPLKCEKGIDSGSHDTGRVIVLEFKEFFLVNVYAPTPLQDLVYRTKIWDPNFLAFLMILTKTQKEIIIVGDLNVSPNDTDYSAEVAHYYTNTLGKNITSEEERTNFNTLLRDGGFVDTFSHLNPIPISTNQQSNNNRWTYWSNGNREKGGRRLDFALVSSPLLSMVTSSVIVGTVSGSDHCPIELVMDFSTTKKNKREDNDQRKKGGKIVLTHRESLNKKGRKTEQRRMKSRQLNTLFCEKCNQSGSQMLVCGLCNDAYHFTCLVLNLAKEEKTPWLCEPCISLVPPLKDKKKKNKNLKILEDLGVSKCQRCREYQDLSSFVEWFSEMKICGECKWSVDTILESENQINRFFQSTVNRFDDEEDIKENSDHSMAKKKNNQHKFKIPSPPKDCEQLQFQKKTLATALLARNMCFDDNLCYSNPYCTPESNDARLEPALKKLDDYNLKIFRQFKKLTCKGNYAPLHVIHDESQGFIVKAQDKIPALTLISEYVGEVDLLRRRLYDSNDSMMDLLNTGHSIQDLIICPESRGNLAQFLSGINNQDPDARETQNVASVRYSINGRSRVLLYATKEISKGMILYYDYNGGTKYGYPTSSFVSG